MKKSDRQKALQVLDKNKSKLQRVSRQLKKYFVGLDDVIDQLISYVEPWFLLPELLDRPVVVNLWGITGIGKTDLIEKFVEYLGYKSSYLKIETFKSDDYSVVDCLYNKYGAEERIQSGGHNILFFDELQNFKTIEWEKGKLKDKEYEFKDFWELLNSGLLDLTSEIEDIAESHLSRKEEKAKAEDHFGYRKVARYRKILEIDVPLEEFASWTVSKVILEAKKYKKKNIKRFFDCRRSLIVLAGNLDEAYPFSTEVANVAWDADELYDLSKEVTFLHIKQALLTRFKPEQIARFGNNHIVYPTLNRSSYEELIRRQANFKTEKIKETYSIDISVEPSLQKLIYDNGVFPTQGVRPIFTTSDSILGSCIPNLILHSLKISSRKLHLAYEEPDILISGPKRSKKPVLKIPYRAALDEIRKTFDKDETAQIAVHETGHAVACALLCGTAPQRIKITATAASLDSIKGYVLLPGIGRSEELILKTIKIFLGGRAAEKLIFGTDLMSDGTYGDISYVTFLASMMVRMTGLYGSDPVRTAPESDWNGEARYTDLDESNDKISQILTKCDREITKLLKPHKELIKEVAKKVQEEKSLDPKTFVAICKKYGIKDLKLSNNKTKINSSWNDILHQKDK